MRQAVFEAAGVASANLVQVAADVHAVEQEIQRQLSSPIQSVERALQLTFQAGGKRLRPAFVLLSARASAPSFDLRRAILIAACMEMIHMATLIHDDVIDEAATRRGHPTAAKVVGNTASILSGDVLLAKAMQILAQDGDLPIIRTTSRMVVEMAEGEAREVELRHQFDVSESDHLHVLRMKTAAFVECCCLVGGMLVGAEEASVTALGEYGHHLGLAFQMADDLLDFRGDPAVTGKPRATDLREGLVTLPLILLRDRMPAGERSKFAERLRAGLSESEITETSDRMEREGIFGEAERRAQDHLSQAMVALSRLPASPHRDLLEAAGRFVLQRSA